MLVDRVGVGMETIDEHHGYDREKAPNTSAFRGWTRKLDTKMTRE